ncbi:MAG TPA: hypothetical protein VFR75_04200 [Solirubrobacterales bacterium]|jgi:hypothetical protein|nr:hypothetical protein [Solirubrobacterales bacterium]
MPGTRAPSERTRPLGMPLLRADERFVEALAATVAEQVADRLHGTAAEGEGYLNPEAAGRYICVSRRRIHELTSAGLLTPDGYDGRTPLYRRQTLDEYVTAAGGKP